MLIASNFLFPTPAPSFPVFYSPPPFRPDLLHQRDPLRRAPQSDGPQPRRVQAARAGCLREDNEGPQEGAGGHLPVGGGGGQDRAREEGQGEPGCSEARKLELAIPVGKALDELYNSVKGYTE